MSRRVRPPSWLDLRLVAGVALVLASVLIGVKVIASANHSERVWAASHDLAPGVVLQASDLRSVSVRLPGGTDGYIPAKTDLVEPKAPRAVNRQINAGELIALSAIGVAQPATTVTVPLDGDNAPKVSPGQRLTVWVSTKACPSAVVLPDVTVQAVQAARGGSLDASGGEDVIVRVSPDLAERVIEALALDGGVLRAGLITGGLPGLAAAGSDGSLPVLSTCAGDS